jgi:hypothetical protein
MVGLTAPAVPFSVWIWAAFDPVLIAVAVTLGWRADQKGKVFIAAIAALGITLVVDWLLTLVGLPILAPISQSGPTLFPVRAVAALLWAAVGYGARRLRDRREKGPA